jgi:long-chain acyl-CoA synthetase
VLSNARRIADRPAFMRRGDGGWEPTTWAEYGADLEAAAAGLVSLGLPAGGAVAVLGFNRREWVTFDTAAMAAGGVPAGIYTTNSAEEVGYILADSAAVAVLVENRAQWEKVAAVRSDLPHLQAVVLMEGDHDIDDSGTISWSRFLTMGGDADRAEVAARMDALRPSTPATLIYTSGTTGPPKGVVLTHDNLAWTASSAIDLLGITADDRTLSYLPLSHIAEQVFSIHAATTAGYPVWFARSVERLRSDLPEANPTVFFGVPRVWEGIERAVRSELKRLDGPKARLAHWGIDAVRSYHRKQMAGGADPITQLAYQAASRLVTDRIKAQIGFGDTTLALSGAAPISADVLDYLAGIDVVVREVYGQSEDTGPTTINTEGNTRFGTVGKPWPGTEVAIGGDGEVLVRGRHVFSGYHGDPEATASTLVDGWLHTGDLGRFDDDGYLVLTGRKKEIIVTSGGKNIAPKLIESMLKREPGIGEAVLVGDGRDYLTALIGLDDDLQRGEEANDLVAAAVGRVNERLSRVEHVRRFEILPRPLSIDGGELTPTLKVKRAVVEERYAGLIDGMYPTT